MLIIDKKRLPLKESGLPQMVIDQAPKLMRRSKLPIVKAKVGPKISVLIADEKVFDLIPVKKEVKAEVRKQGQVNVHMVFEQGKKNMTLYSTPFGTLQMGIAATGLEIMEDEDCIQMKVDYALDMNDEHVADCYLTVQAQSKDLGDFSFYEN